MHTQKITSVTSLKEAIRQLEEKQTADKDLLRAEMHLTLERLKPVNLLRSTLDDAFTSSGLMNSILGAAFGQTAGYVSRKIVVGQTKNPIKRLFGSLLQTGITAFITAYGDTIRETAGIILKVLFKKKEEPDTEPVE